MEFGQVRILSADEMKFSLRWKYRPGSVFLFATKTEALSKPCDGQRQRERYEYDSPADAWH